MKENQSKHLLVIRLSRSCFSPLMANQICADAQNKNLTHIPLGLHILDKAQVPLFYCL
jgi:hypothetical protein